MLDDEAAKKAIEGLNGAEVDGRTIVVNQAHDKSDDNRSSNYENRRRSY
jgi:RNA recognition motif-containing protein